MCDVVEMEGLVGERASIAGAQMVFLISSDVRARRGCDVRTGNQMLHLQCLHVIAAVGNKRVPAAR